MYLTRHMRDTKRYAAMPSAKASMAERSLLNDAAVGGEAEGAGEDDTE